MNKKLLLFKIKLSNNKMKLNNTKNNQKNKSKLKNKWNYLLMIKKKQFKKIQKMARRKNKILMITRSKNWRKYNS